VTVVLGRSAAHRGLLELVRRAASTDVEVLIEGPSGVGKELYARLIHEQSRRGSYPFVPVNGKGSDEDMAPDPPGEYAQSCVGRERMFEYFSRKHSTPGRLFRLNYAIDMRYGVLHDIAGKVLQGKPIDVSLGHVNFIWQGDASAQALRCLAHCDTPTSPLNVSGHEILAVRDLAAKFGQRFGRAPVLVGKEQPTAWLTNTSQAVKLFGQPVVDTEQLISWTADWVSRSMPSLGKPTKYEVRDGRY